MATRGTIEVEDVKYCKVYIHWDCYPEAKLPFLEHFNKEFTTSRGKDPEYKIAQLLRATARLQDAYDLDSSETTGYGIVPYTEDMGADYHYLLKTDGTVECRNAHDDSLVTI